MDTVKFIAQLATERQLERAVQSFHATQERAESTGARYLASAECVPGDKVLIIELSQVVVSVFSVMPDGSVKRSDGEARQ